MKWKSFRIAVCAMAVAMIFAGITASAEITDTISYAATDYEYALPYAEIGYSYMDGGSESTFSAQFTYSDSMLLVDENEFSSDIAKASVALAMAAYSEGKVESSLEKMGYACRDNSTQYERKMNIFDCDHVAYTIASKTIADESGRKFIAYCVPVCGTRANSEWFSDFNIGESNDHAGFYTAASEVMSDLSACMANDGYANSDTIIWLTGHSRGAAVSNIIAGKLTGSGSYAKVFAYTFACPSVSKNADTSYGNIFNFNNPGDLIPTLPLESWGWKRYGRTIDLSLSHLSNFKRQFGSYVGATSDSEWISILSSIFTSESSIHEPESKAVLMLVGYRLGGHNDTTIPELLAYAGVNLTDDSIRKVLLSYAGALGELLTKLDLLAEQYSECIAFIEANSGKMAAMSEDEFKQFMAENQSMFTIMTNVSSFTITSSVDVGRSKSDLYASIECKNRVWDIINAAISLVGDTQTCNLMQSITHGHTQRTYVLWINSMFYGYKGWYGNDSITSVEAESSWNIKGIGGSCFKGCTALESFSSDAPMKHIGADAFSGCTLLDMSLEFGGGLAYLGSGAFYKCSGISSVADLQGALTNIGAETFYGCSGITELIIPDGVTSLGRKAFWNCSGIKKITMPISCEYNTTYTSDYTYTRYATFYNCSSVEEIVYTIGNGTVFEHGSWYSLTYCCKNTLKKAEFEEGITALPACAFKDCSHIEEVILPATLTMVSDFAFDGCSLLTTLVLPESVTSIGKSAFSDCSALTSMVIPDGVASIGSFAFSNCSALTSMAIPKGVTSIEAYVFSNCPLLEGEFPITDATQYIGNNAFYGCSSLTGKVKIPDSFTEIPQYAFYGCAGMTELIIPDGVAALGAGAFTDCSGLKIITLPISCEYVTNRYSTRTFSGCSGIEEIIYTTGDGTVFEADYLLSSFCGGSVKKATFEEGITALPEKVLQGCGILTELSLPDTLTMVSGHAFSGCCSLTAVTIPDGVTDIGDSAFYGCSALTTMDIPEGVTSIGNSVFYGCSALTAMDIPEGVTSIGDSVFYGCSALTAVEIPEGVTSIGNSAFHGCSALTAMEIPEGITSIGDSVFYGCSALTAVEIPEGVTSIGNSAFHRCSALTSMAIPKGVTSIGNYAFYECQSLTGDFPIWETTESIGESAFYHCYKLEGDVKIPDGITEIKDYAFTCCYGLKSITIPESVMSIGIWAFNGCPLTEIDIPESVTSIGNYAFQSCDGLREVVIPSGVTSIGRSAFWDCSFLADITFHHTEEDVLDIGYEAFWLRNSLDTIIHVLDESSRNEAIDAYDWSTGKRNVRFASLPKIEVNGIEISADDAASIGIPLKLNVVVDSEEASGAILRWEVDDSTVAEIRQNGVLIFLRAGYATVTVSVSNAVNSVSADITLECEGTRILTLPSMLDQISEEAFAGCNAEIIILPDGIRIIGARAFADCLNLYKVVIPDSVDEIAEDALDGSPYVVFYVRGR